MIFGLTTSTYTFVHVLLSLVGIGSGLVILFGLLAGKRLGGWTALFLASTVATSVTGFGFPSDHFSPAHGVGVISLLVLALATMPNAGLCRMHMRNALLEAIRSQLRESAHASHRHSPRG